MTFRGFAPPTFGSPATPATPANAPMTPYTPNYNQKSGNPSLFTISSEQSISQALTIFKPQQILSAIQEATHPPAEFPIPGIGPGFLHIPILGGWVSGERVYAIRDQATEAVKKIPKPQPRGLSSITPPQSALRPSFPEVSMSSPFGQQITSLNKPMTAFPHFRVPNQAQTPFTPTPALGARPGNTFTPIESPIKESDLERLNVRFPKPTRFKTGVVPISGSSSSTSQLNGPEAPLSPTIIPQLISPTPSAATPATTSPDPLPTPPLSIQSPTSQYSAASPPAQQRSSKRRPHGTTQPRPARRSRGTVQPGKGNLYHALLSAYISTMLNVEVPADTKHISLRGCKSHVGDEFGIGPHPNSERAKAWFKKGGMASWKIRDKPKFIEILIAGEIVVTVGGVRMVRKKGVELWLADGTVLRSNEIENIPYDDKMRLEGLAIELDKDKDAELNKVRIHDWNPFQGRILRFNWDDRHGEEDATDDDNLDDTEDGSDPMMIDSDDELFEMMSQSCENHRDGDVSYSGLGDLGLIAQYNDTHGSARCPEPPRMQGRPGNANQRVPRPAEVLVQEASEKPEDMDLPNPHMYNLPKGVSPPKSMDEYLARAPRDESGNIIPHAPLSYPLDEFVPVYEKSDETLAQAKAFKGDHDDYFPPTQELHDKFKGIPAWDPNELAPAKTIPRILQLPIYSRQHEKPIVIHPGLEVEQVHQLVCDGTIALPQCAVLLPEQIRTRSVPEGRPFPEFAINWYHPGMEEPVYANDPHRKRTRKSAKQRIEQKKARRERMSKNRELQVDSVCRDEVMDDGIEEGREILRYAPEQERAGGECEGRRYARQLWEKRQGKGKQSQRGRKPKIKTQDEKEQERIRKEAIVQRKLEAQKRETGAQSQKKSITRRVPYSKDGGRNGRGNPPTGVDADSEAAHSPAQPVRRVGPVSNIPRVRQVQHQVAKPNAQLQHPPDHRIQSMQHASRVEQDQPLHQDRYPVQEFHQDMSLQTRLNLKEPVHGHVQQPQHTITSSASSLRGYQAHSRPVNVNRNQVSTAQDSNASHNSLAAGQPLMSSAIDQVHDIDPKVPDHVRILATVAKRLRTLKNDDHALTLAGMLTHKNISSWSNDTVGAMLVMALQHLDAMQVGTNDDTRPPAQEGLENIDPTLLVRPALSQDDASMSASQQSVTSVPESTGYMGQNIGTNVNFATPISKRINNNVRKSGAGITFKPMTSNDLMLNNEDNFNAIFNEFIAMPSDGQDDGQRASQRSDTSQPMEIDQNSNNLFPATLSSAPTLSPSNDHMEEDEITRILTAPLTIEFDRGNEDPGILDAHVSNSSADNLRNDDAQNPIAAEHPIGNEDASSDVSLSISMNTDIGIGNDASLQNPMALTQMGPPSNAMNDIGIGGLLGSTSMTTSETHVGGDVFLSSDLLMDSDLSDWLSSLDTESSLDDRAIDTRMTFEEAFATSTNWEGCKGLSEQTETDDVQIDEAPAVVAQGGLANGADTPVQCSFDDLCNGEVEL